MRLTAEGDADPAVACERYLRFALWSTWAPQIRAVRLDVGAAGGDSARGDVQAGAERLAPGVTGTVLGPPGVRVRFRVDDVEVGGGRADRLAWSWTVRPAGPLRVLTADRVRLQLTHTVRARPGGGSITTLDVSGPRAVVASYAPLALLALRRLVRA